MALPPKPPPVSTPLVDSSGKLTLEWYKYLTGGVTYSQNVNSGVNEARAAAEAAQTAAEAAQQQAADVATAAGVTFTAMVSPYAAIGTRSGSGAATTNSVTATPTGGTGPYLYAWALVSGDTFTVNSPTSATTTFTASVGPGEDKTAIYRVTITDSLLATATATVSVTVSEIS